MRNYSSLLRRSWRNYQVNENYRRDVASANLTQRPLTPSGFPHLFLDRISYNNDRVLIEGWTSAAGVSGLAQSGEPLICTQYEREDLESLPFKAIGFSVQGDALEEAIYVVLDDPGESKCIVHVTLE